LPEVCGDYVAGLQVGARQRQVRILGAGAGEHPLGEPGDLEGDERRDRVADVTVGVLAAGHGELVIAGEPLQDRHLPDCAQPVLLRVGVAAVADVAALPLDGRCRAVPGHPAVHVAEVVQGPGLDGSPHGGDEVLLLVLVAEEVCPASPVLGDRPDAVQHVPLGAGAGVGRVRVQRLPAVDRRQVPDCPPHVGGFLVDHQAAPQVLQPGQGGAVAGGEYHRALPLLGKAEPGEHVDVAANPVAHGLKGFPETAVMVAEPAAQKLPRILHEDNPGLEIRGVFRYPGNQ
jgi:hypothetical protein